jgi:HEAT repeat protein
MRPTAKRNRKDGGEVISALGEIGPDAKEAAPNLRKALTSHIDWIRIEAAIALAKIDNPENPELLQVLESAAASSEFAQHRVKAAQALWTFYRRLGPLLERLRENNYYASAEAARTLGEIGSDAREAVPDLVKSLKHKHLDVRVAARSALKKIDPKAAAKAG